MFEKIVIKRRTLYLCFPSTSSRVNFENVSMSRYGYLAFISEGVVDHIFS